MGLMLTMMLMIRGSRSVCYYSTVDVARFQCCLSAYLLFVALCLLAF